MGGNIEGSQRCLGHRQQKGPGVVFLKEELMVSVGNEHVFAHSAEERLTGDLPDDGRNGLHVVGEKSKKPDGGVVP